MTQSSDVRPARLARPDRAWPESRWPSWWALTRVEAGRLLTHPIVMSCGGLTIALVIGQSFSPDEDLLSYKAVAGAALLPVAVAVMLGATLAASRERRCGTDEMLAALPLQQSARTAALLATVVAAIVVGAIFETVLVISLQTWDGLEVPALPGDATMGSVVPSVAALLQGPALVALGGALGVALARWIPSLLAAGVVAGGALVCWTAVLWWDWGWQRFLLPLAHDLRIGEAVEVGSNDSVRLVHGTAPDTATWHLVYVAGLVFVAAGMALLHDAPRKGAAMLTAGGLSAMTTGGVMQVAAWPG